MKAIKLPHVPVQYDTVRCEGGWDQVTPSLSLKAGVLRGCLNFEVAPNGGYSRISGYERVDGRPAPSESTYSLVQVVVFLQVPTVGQTITGLSSTATGRVILVGADFVVITKKTGSFWLNETIAVGATAIGITTDVTATVTIKQDAQYNNLAADVYRADILAVPGSGSVRGVQLFNDILYAFRDNASGTAINMYKATASGWVQVVFDYEISFTNANISVIDAATLTQGLVSSTILRVVTETGTLQSGVNTGRLIISTPAGGDFTSGSATSTGGGVITLSAAQTRITFNAGGTVGKFEFDQANFFGQLSGLRLYGCDGVNRMFEFDGTTLIPISTKVTPDAPKHLVAFKNHLFCSIQSSIIHSGVGKPYNFSSTAGGGEIATGDRLTGFKVQPGVQSVGALAVGGRNTIFMLYGTSLADWNFTTYSAGVGALDFSMQNMSQSYFLDDRGVIGLQASQVYGNFEQATLTNAISSFIREKRTMVSYSSLSRERSQYRVFFNDGYGLYLTIVNGKFLGATQVLFNTPVYCACTGEMSSGDERLYFGGTDGFVYQLDKGTSFDGENITANIMFNWSSQGTPRIVKRYRRASIEIQGSNYAEVEFSYQLAYGSSKRIQPSPTTVESNFSSSNWDAGIPWDSTFFWDGNTLTPTEIAMDGSGENVQITLASSLDYIHPFTINSLIIHYTPRRGLR